MKLLRIFMTLVALIQLVFGIGYAFLMPFALSLWPFSYTGNMSHIFVGSIFCAAAASTLWCIWEGEDAALSGIGLDYIAIFFPLGVFALQTAQGNSAQTLFGVAGVFGGVVGVLLFLFTWRRRMTPQPAVPRLVFISFLIFALALFFVGGQMVLKVPDVVPWQLTTTGSVIYGWMFLGAAVYFSYTLLRPSWHNAGGQLAGFLAYDLVLIWPFIQRLPTLEGRFVPSQIFYLIVVSYSGLLGIYYLFIHPNTRVRRGQVMPA